MLRQWQSNCLSTALTHFENGNKHFLCVATPGSGKTYFSATLAHSLKESDRVEFIVCLAPSVNVKEGIENTFASVMGQPFDGKFGAAGICLTYQAFQSHFLEFADRLASVKTLLVLDENHHCGGFREEVATSWAKPLLYFIDRVSPYILSLSGTPWRTDGLPITTLQYDSNAAVNANYVYGLRDAVRDQVCRHPQIHLVDNTHWKVTDIDKSNRYHGSLQALLTNEMVSYQLILEDECFLTHMLQLAEKKLAENRACCGDAGGLIVASSIAHAKMICKLILHISGEAPILVTSDEADSQKALRHFKHSSVKWLVSVGMVSEGTDIPRLQVCCHLSRIRTELHFRQLLGRILRVRKQDSKTSAELIVPAHMDIALYAERLLEEIPNSPDIVKYSRIDHEVTGNREQTNLSCIVGKKNLKTLPNSFEIDSLDLTQSNTLFSGPKRADLNSSAQIGIYGRYFEEVMRYNLT